MKKILLYVSVILFCAGCEMMNKNDTALPPSQQKEVPSVELSYRVDGAVYTLTALKGTSSWTYENGDGTSTCVESDSVHPLDAVAHMPDINKTVSLTSLTISFSLPPDSYKVRRWSEKYIGNPQAYENFYETVNISNDIIALLDDGQGYVYEVHATWPQGNAYYSFYVANSTAMPIDDNSEASMILRENGRKTPYDTVNELDGVTIEIKDGSSSATGLLAIVKNENEYECTFGTWFCLEKRGADSWYQLPYATEDNIGWDDIAYPVGKNSLNKELELKLDWDWLYGKLDPGEYRIIKDAFIDNDWKTKYYVSAEFIIE